MSLRAEGASKAPEIKIISTRTEKTENKKAANVTKSQSEDELIDIEDLLEEGVLKEEKAFFGLFKTGNYILIADGKKSYADIKEEFDLASGSLRSANYKLFSKIEGNADDEIPEKGTKITIKGKDIKPQPLDFKDDSGETIDGLYKGHDGTVFYEIQYGDTKEGIYKKFENKSISQNYKTSDVLRGYSEYTLQPGAKVTLEEKSRVGKFFSKLFS